MTTISTPLAMATVLTTRFIIRAPLSAAPQAASHAVGLVAVVAVLILLAALAAVARAARALVALITEFLRLAAAMTSVMLAVLISALVIGVLLVHH